MMHGVPNWQAYLAIDDDDVAPIRSVASERLLAEEFGIVTELFPDGSEGATQLALDVEAESLGGAINAVAHTWNGLREHARLVRSPPKVDFVVGPIDRNVLLYHAVSQRARRLVAAGQPSYAVVAAQTAVEIFIKGALRDLMRHVMPPMVAESMAPRAPTLRGRSSAALFEALTGRRPAAAGAVWTDYDAHAKRRHGIVHDGLEISADEANESIKSVEALISWLDNAVA
jgi:hypothetical protein